MDSLPDYPASYESTNHRVKVALTAYEAEKLADAIVLSRRGSFCGRINSQ